MALINKHYNDCYFSVDSGYLESKYLFIEGNLLEDRLSSGFNIGETGFGTGLNLLVLEEYMLSLGFEDISITFSTVEKYILAPKVVEEALSEVSGVGDEALSRHMELYRMIFKALKNGWNTFVVKRNWGELTINLYYGDILDSFKTYPIINDAWFLDGHSPDKNPEMWSSNLFLRVAKVSKQGTTFATFTAAGVVKQGLRNAGFFVKRKKGFGKKRHMILGSL